MADAGQEIEVLQSTVNAVEIKLQNGLDIIGTGKAIATQVDQSGVVQTAQAVASNISDSGLISTAQFLATSWQPDLFETAVKFSYEQVVEVAERYDMVINIEPHGYYTTKPEFMEKMLSFVDSPYLRMNMDTGNTFIAGQDPVAFLEKFKDKVSHVHVKDVSESLAKSLRGELTGIAVSNCAIGDGVNRENIEKCIDILVDANFDGVISLECEGQGGPLIEKSLAYVRTLVNNANKRMAEN